MILIPNYQILAQIYESSNSLVYRAIRITDSQPVILKLLKQEYPTPNQLIRYRQEYEITRTLNLEGICRSLGLERYYNTLIIVFEDFGAESLKVWINNNQFSLESFLQIAIATTKSLASIHANNIIHKDINPSNIVYNPNTRKLKIIDFGISTVLSRENLTLKNPNILEGTLAYMSPEQTGRMNRTLDYRTDFYSLGITFYEFLTHQLPFDTTDALELVHCHIAKQPLPPEEINPKIPQVVSNIVMKLLAKTAENRYQSALGIKADLEQCLYQLQNTGKILNFPLNNQIISDKFQISEKLYGREKEINTLISAFERVHQQSEIMLIAGYSGVGKSALVQEIYKPITQKRGYFISGKFDQYQRNIPYSAIVKAFRELVQQLLTEASEKLEEWKSKIMTTLGINAQVIIDVIPEVELIIGKQPEVLELELAEAQNRFNLVFQNFVKVFISPNSPLVIFLDDLQWADDASLKLMQLLIGTSSPGLFLIGAYRDNEVSSAHPLILTLNEIAKNGTVVNKIFLSPLKIHTVTQLITDTLKCSEENAQPLAELVNFKTGGNPFFLNEFLRSLYTEGMLEFNVQTTTWQWDLEKIKQRDFTDNVVELMARRIQKLPKSTQEILKIAACIGNQFDLQTLRFVINKSLDEIATDLRTAVTETLILSLADIGNIELALGEIESGNTTEYGKLSYPLLLLEYRFIHDRIQQAAYALIPENDKPVIHQQIGKILLKNISAEQREEKIFNIVNQLNFGISLISTQRERDELGQLNLVAGKRAKASAAYLPALNYLKVGIDLLGETGWRNEYNLVLQLYIEAVEAAYVSGDFEQMQKLITIVMQQAKTVLDKVQVIDVKIMALIAQNRLLEAINTGLEILNQLGIKIPKNPNDLDVITEFIKSRLAFAGKRVLDLAALPLMTDPYKLAALRILLRIFSPAYFIGSKLSPIFVFKQIYLMIKYGNSAEFIHGYATYGLILAGVIGDIDLAYEFGQLTLKLLEQYQAIPFKAKSLSLTHGAITHWKKHAKETLPHLLEGYKRGIETGNLEHSAYAISLFCYNSYLTGIQLSELKPQIATYCEAFEQLKQRHVLWMLQPYYQAVINILDYSVSETATKQPKPWILIGNAYNEQTMLPILIEANHGSAIFHLYLNKQILCYLFREYSEAVLSAAYTEKYLSSSTATLSVAYFYFYDSLARLAWYDKAPKSQQKQLLKKVVANQKKMKKWATHAPMNYLHKFYLVEAEKYRVLGKALLAIDYYDRALALAKENEYINEAAIAYELAAQFFISKGKDLSAKAYMQEAYYCYQLWGATAKVKDLERNYPQLLAINQPRNQEIKTTVSTSGSHSNSSLDIATAIKASQTISQEIVLENLLSSLMQILIENAGAQTGYLLLAERGNLFIEAAREVDSDRVTVLQSIPIENSRAVSPGVINYVARTHESVVLHNASNEGLFTQDSYIQASQPLSILCVPLLHQGKLTGVIYLENNLITGAFTPERIEVINLLSSQAAISIENARFYSTLEARVAERTAELKQTQLQLQHRAQVESLLSSISRQFIDRDADIATQFALEAIAQFLGAQRSCIFELSPHQSQLNLIYEWCAIDVAPLSSDAVEGSIKEMPYCYEQILNGNPVYFPSIASLPAEIPERMLFESQSIQSVVIVPMIYSGKVVGFIGMDTVHFPKTWGVEDISLLKLVGELIAIGRARYQAESALKVAKDAAEAANRAKSVFLASMSHELRTPLNAILGFAQLMERDSTLKPNQKESLVIINRSGSHLLNLINDVLEMSKIEAGRIVLNLETFSLLSLLQNLEEMFQIRTQAKQLFLQFEVAADVPEYIVTDQGKLRQVLINLLGNAAKFTQIGGITLRVQVIQKQEDLITTQQIASELQEDVQTNSSVHPDTSVPQLTYVTPTTTSELLLQFEIEDTGKGIAPEEMERLFQAFVQTTTGMQAREGTGLGLAISRQYVQLMGGDIKCISTIGQGSIFRFTVQVTLAEPLVETVLPSNKQRVLHLAPNQPDYRVLVVDDHPESRELLLRLLQTVGFEAKSAANGSEAIAFWQQWHPHLIWMDMQMPLLDGYEATRKIKAIEQDSIGKVSESQTIIIALTASAFEEQRTNIIAAGCDDFVRKPFQEQTIFEKMAQYLGVQYIYTQESESQVVQDSQSNLGTTEQFKSVLNNLPVEWKAQLHQAAIEVDADKIVQLIKQLPNSHVALVQKLTQLVRYYCFDEILELIQED